MFDIHLSLFVRIFQNYLKMILIQYKVSASNPINFYLEACGLWPFWWLLKILNCFDTKHNDRTISTAFFLLNDVHPTIIKVALGKWLNIWLRPLIFGTTQIRWIKKTKNKNASNIISHWWDKSTQNPLWIVHEKAKTPCDFLGEGTH
jgi:hypothetical protein